MLRRHLVLCSCCATWPWRRKAKYTLCPTHERCQYCWMLLPGRRRIQTVGHMQLQPSGLLCTKGKRCDPAASLGLLLHYHFLLVHCIATSLLLESCSSIVTRHPQLSLFRCKIYKVVGGVHAHNHWSALCIKHDTEGVIHSLFNKAVFWCALTKFRHVLMSILMQVKASLRSIPQAQAQLQDAEAACFASHRLWLQQNPPEPEHHEQSGATISGTAKHNMHALQALQMILLLLEFSPAK